MMAFRDMESDERGMAVAATDCPQFDITRLGNPIQTSLQFCYTATCFFLTRTYAGHRL